MDLQERINLKKANRTELYSLEPPFPYSNFLIETSNACNHACIFCAHQKMKRPVGKINPDFVYDILQQAYDLGTREVGFYATGEPFLVPELPDYIVKAKEIGYNYVYLTSNGVLATPEKIRAVIDAGLDSIKFSINAPEREMYAFIHGRDDFDAVFEHLRYLNEYRESSGKQYKIFVTGILTRFTEKMKDQYFEVFKGLADEIVFKLVYNQGGYMPEIETLLKCECDTETYRRCNLPFDAISVTHEGYLSVENADFENMLVVADLNKVSLKDAWYGKKMKEIRQMFLSDKLEGTVCDGCVHRTKRPAKAILPEYATNNLDIFSDALVRERIKTHRALVDSVLGEGATDRMCGKTVYVPMAVDILHPGHINIIKKASALGEVTVGLFTDEAIASYKPAPYMNYEMRKAVIENVKGVSRVVPQTTRDYEPNLRKYKPDYMVHGTDWSEGPLADVREKAIRVMAEWHGVVVEPAYTEGVSSSVIKKKIKDKCWMESMMGKVYWVTGLAGAGKTTIGHLLYERLRKEHENVVLLDGDILRGVFQGMGGFGSKDRKVYASAYGRLCKMLSDQGLDVVCCTVSMFDDVRAWNRSHITRYFEIFLDVPIEILKKRDQKGLYSGAIRGEVKDVVGMDLNMEMPRHPDVRIVNDGSLPPVEVAEKIWDALGCKEGDTRYES